MPRCTCVRLIGRVLDGLGVIIGASNLPTANSPIRYLTSQPTRNRRSNEFGFHLVRKYLGNVIVFSLLQGRSVWKRSLFPTHRPSARPWSALSQSSHASSKPPKPPDPPECCPAPCAPHPSSSSSLNSPTMELLFTKTPRFSMSREITDMKQDRYASNRSAQSSSLLASCAV